MRIGIVTIAYNLPEATRKLYESVQATKGEHEVEYHLFLHSRNPEVVEVCEAIAQDPDVIYHDYGINRGLSKSWNDGLLWAYLDRDISLFVKARYNEDVGYQTVNLGGQIIPACDVVIVVNDDCVFGDGDLIKLAEYAVKHRDLYMVTCMGHNHRHNKRMPLEYSCFALNPIALQRVGVFDENIFPIYLEDCDYAYRAKLAGLKMGMVENTNVAHQGSGAIYADPALMAQHNITFAANMSYYMRKWGGVNEQEKYTSPFNNPNFDAYISPDVRQVPYGANYDRLHEVDKLVKI